MRQPLFALCALSAAMMGAGDLEAQSAPAPPKGPELLMHPQYESGQPVSPIFEGWYRNPDGSYTLSFGFFNRNSTDTLEIPIGENNYIEPAEYNGGQPSSFPTDPEAFSVGRGWGVFSVVVPASFQPGQDVIWTLRSEGRTHSVPGRIGIYEYRLGDIDQPAGNGSMPPRVRFEPNGPEGIGRAGLYSSRTLRTRVGQPVVVNLWAKDNFDPAMRQEVQLNVEWAKHQGPPEGRISFDPARNRIPAGGETTSTSVTFSAPGEYVIRVTTMPTDVRDSSYQDQCCWSNGFVRVSVAP